MVRYYIFCLTYISILYGFTTPVSAYYYKIEKISSESMVVTALHDICNS